MLRSVVQASLKSPFVVLVLAAGLVLFGMTRLRNMPIDVLPEFSPPYVEIQTEALGLSAEEVEQLITVPMEHDLLNGAPWLETIRSESVTGLSSVVLVFKRGTDLMQARQMVSERMTQAVALPHVSKPPVMLQPLSAASRVLIVGLSSKSLSPIQMGVLARWTIAPRLMGVSGVANVAIWGQRDRQLQVQVDPKRLRDHRISILKVLETTGNALWVSSLSFVEASTPGTGGFIDTSTQRLGIRHILPIVSPEGLAQVPIEDTKLHLGDIATVVENHQPLIGDALTKDGSGILLVIEKFPAANTLAVTHEVEEALGELGPGLAGMEVDPNIFRPADFIEASIHNLALTVLLGFLLVAAVLAVVFLEWRRVAIGMLAIPLSLIAAGSVLYLTGATMNTIVLMGFVIAIGAVVYDAILDVDNIARRVRENRTQGASKARIVLEASLEARGTIIYATLILLLTVSPIFFIEGSSGAFFFPLAVSYGLAVVASMVVALTVTPALCLVLLSHAPVEHRASPFVTWLQARCDAPIGWIVQRGRLAVVGVGALAVVGLVALPFLDRSLLPSFKERNLLIHLDCVPGTSQPETSRISGLVARELRSIPGIRDVGAHIGRAVQGDQVVDVNSAQLWVSIDPSSDYAATTAAIQRVLDGFPGVRHDVETYLRGRSSDVVPAAADSIVVRVYGDVDEVLSSQAEIVKESIADINGISDTRVKTPVQQAILETQVDLAAAQRVGLKPGDVRRAAATLLSGIVVGSLFEEQKVFDVVVWSTPETRRSLSDISDLLIDKPGGGHARLGDVAKVRVVPTASVIRHEGVKRYIDVIADVPGRDLAAVAADIKDRLQQLQFPLEYHARVLDEYAAPQAAQSRLLILTISAAIGVFFLLQAAFGSWRLAALSFLTLPVALVGGVLAALLTGGVLSLGSVAGMLVVLGIAASNKLLLINHYQHLERDEGEAFGPGLVLRGTRERLAPILTAMSATALALLPVLLLGDVPGLEIVRPMAIVVLGGVVSAALLDLCLLPALYLKLGVRAADLDPSGAEVSEGVFDDAAATHRLAVGE
jgi:Cu/Ag efflux pump CusA